MASMRIFSELPEDIARVIMKKAIELRHDHRFGGGHRLEAALKLFDSGRVSGRKSADAGPRVTATKLRNGDMVIGFEIRGYRFMCKRFGNRYTLRPLKKCPFEQEVFSVFYKVFAGREIRAFSTSEWVPRDWQ